MEVGTSLVLLNVSGPLFPHLSSTGIAGTQFEVGTLRKGHWCHIIANITLLKKLFLMILL